MSRQLANNLLRLAEIYRAHRPQALVTVSKKMAHDSGLLTRIARADAGFTVGKYDEIVQRFSNYWPDGGMAGLGRAEWPNDIPRPKATQKLVQKVYPRRSRTAAVVSEE